jgi:hypothetical protein
MLQAVRCAGCTELSSTKQVKQGGGRTSPEQGRGRTDSERHPQQAADLLLELLLQVGWQFTTRLHSTEGARQPDRSTVGYDCPRHTGCSGHKSTQRCRAVQVQCCRVSRVPQASTRTCRMWMHVAAIAADAMVASLEGASAALVPAACTAQHSTAHLGQQTAQLG